jgi:hypothetical protein
MDANFQDQAIDAKTLSDANFQDQPTDQELIDQQNALNEQAQQQVEVGDLDLLLYNN